MANPSSREHTFQQVCVDFHAGHWHVPAYRSGNPITQVRSPKADQHILATKGRGWIAIQNSDGGDRDKGRARIALNKLLLKIDGEELKGIRTPADTSRVPRPAFKLDAPAAEPNSILAQTYRLPGCKPSHLDSERPAWAVRTYFRQRNAAHDTIGIHCGLHMANR